MWAGSGHRANAGHIGTNVKEWLCVIAADAA